MSLSDWPIGEPIGISCIDDWCGRTQTTVLGATPGWVVLRYI